MSNAVAGRLDSLRIVVLGYVVRGPLGGMVWSNLHFLMGLRDLGHDVYFLEDSGDLLCYDPARNVSDRDPSYGLEFARQVFGRIGFADRWAYHDAFTSRWFGPCAETIKDICKNSDVLLNLCNVNPLRDWVMEIPVRVYVDEDPAFTQVRHLRSAQRADESSKHTAFFSFGENLGSPNCKVPDDGFPWKPTRQPLVLDAVQTSGGPVSGPFTTIMLWESYRSLEYQDSSYGMKSVSFQDYVDLPQSASADLELAISGPGVPRDKLRAKGWRLVDGRQPTVDPWAYQDYIRGSRAEFSVAKHGYVVSHSGWFSERSVTYLASGRPVLVQDTGFTDWLPTGEGVLAFCNPSEALAGIADINRRYEHHCRQARSIAEEYFDSRKVLTSLLERAKHNSCVQPRRAAL